jgi:uncharacterized membrane protein YphA (DoxX/SURF4 family)
MDIFFWTLQALLALIFAGAGARKLRMSRGEFVARQPWAADIPHGGLRAIGVLELLGAAGLILPAATGIAPLLTPLAAAGLALTMIGATALHLRRHAYRNTGPTLVLLAIAVTLVAALI